MRSDGKTFGQRLREARIRAGLSQSDLEEISGIPKARLSRYENGHVSPSIHTLERLARALGVSEASLLGDERAVLEGFFAALDARGIRIDSTERAARVANALADLVEALRGDQPAGLGGDRTDEQVAATVESVERWLAEGGDRLSD
ncbi:MAG TPA: helix-turn-helix transcriptional regulator [Actinomycetota bacterium]|jgi:transcriptional regulator with XRE-family HTH domain|nr:helix-turn-helix transcriptional regulator [Actinomycetota bacterium]